MTEAEDEAGDDGEKRRRRRKVEVAKVEVEKVEVAGNHVKLAQKGSPPSGAARGPLNRFGTPTGALAMFWYFLRHRNFAGERSIST
ncbi:hypothetical protein A7C99_2476 [Trichophyton rubrum]|uniref:Uncharacterized protein n=1 Tax=Trichophyton rubrum TaxID=5551 RepID=A0A178EZ19_TRIRU|nr:hypothetical protein A7C99_2476 [Trichophyton rubrum]